MSKRQSVKAYKLHVKYEAKKSCITIPPDHSIQQLKQMIHSQFNLKPEEQSLLCNGKPLCTSDNTTLKQAKIPNNSKIALNRVQFSPTKIDQTGGLLQKSMA